MSAVNFLARSSMGAFPAAGDQQLPWLPAEEGPDLLDRLIQVRTCLIFLDLAPWLASPLDQQEKEERIAAAALPLAMQVNAICMYFIYRVSYDMISHLFVCAACGAAWQT